MAANVILIKLWWIKSSRLHQRGRWCCWGSRCSSARLSDRSFSLTHSISFVHLELKPTWVKVMASMTLPMSSCLLLNFNIHVLLSAPIIIVNNVEVVIVFISVASSSSHHYRIDDTVCVMDLHIVACNSSHMHLNPSSQSLFLLGHTWCSPAFPSFGT